MSVFKHKWDPTRLSKLKQDFLFYSKLRGYGGWSKAAEVVGDVAFLDEYNRRSQRLREGGSFWESGSSPEELGVTGLPEFDPRAPWTLDEMPNWLWGDMDPGRRGRIAVTWRYLKPEWRRRRWFQDFNERLAPYYTRNRFRG